MSCIILIPYQNDMVLISIMVGFDEVEIKNVISAVSVIDQGDTSLRYMGSLVYKLS